MAAHFPYIQAHGVVLCVKCQTCLLPTRSSQERHLRQPPHHYKGPQLQALLALFAAYELELPSRVVPPHSPCSAIKGLRCYPTFTCRLCNGCLTWSKHALEVHVSREHKQKPAQQVEGSSWRKCIVQTFFAEKQHIWYFVVDDDATGASDASTASLDSGEEDFFKQLSEDVAVAEADAKAEADVVHGFDSHKSAVVPWLRRTGIEEHTRGLRKDEMHASFAVPKAAESEPELFLILEVMDEIFREAHSWCLDGPDCMLTWPWQLALSRFYTAATTGQKTRGFDPKKEPSTLKTNFGYWKQFLTYTY